MPNRKARISNADLQNIESPYLENRRNNLPIQWYVSLLLFVTKMTLVYMRKTCMVNYTVVFLPSENLTLNRPPPNKNRILLL